MTAETPKLLDVDEAALAESEFPKVSTLRTAPIVGETYLVPVVENFLGGPPDHWFSPFALRIPFHPRWSSWPVMGPPHADNDMPPELKCLDWHVDYRFVSERQEAVAAELERGEILIGGEWVCLLDDGAHWFAPAGHYWPGLRLLQQMQIYQYGPIPQTWFPRPPKLKPLVCRRPTPPRFHQPFVPFDWCGMGLQEPAQAIVTRTGRELCPHQKMDLSQFPRDESGVVVCPLHGLRVQCRPVSA